MSITNNIDFSPPFSPDDPFNNLNTPNADPSFARDKAAVWETAVSLNDFMYAVSSAKTNLKKQLQSDVIDSLAMKAASYRSFAETSASMLQIYDQIVFLNQRETELYNKQVAQNTVIASYNSSLSTLNNARTTLNNAINTYNNIKPATTASINNLNTAIANYNNAVSSTVSQYNQTASTFNDYIWRVSFDDLVRGFYGMPPLTLSAAPSSGVPYGSGLTILGVTTTTPPPSVPTLPTFPSLSLIPLNSAPISDAEAILRYFPENLVGGTFFGSFLLLYGGDLQQSIKDFLASINDNGDPTLPAAYIAKRPEILINAPTLAGSGGGVSSIAVAVGMGSKSIERIIMRALAQSYYLQENREPPKKLLESLNSFVGGVITQAAVEAALSPASVEISSDLSQKTPPIAAGLIRATSFAEALRLSSSSGVIDQGINRLLMQEPALAGLPLGEKKDLAEGVSGSLKVLLSQLGLLQIGLSLGLKGLVGQVMAGLPGAPEVGLLFASSEAENLGSILQDPFKQMLLKSKIDGFLTEQGFKDLSSKVLDNIFLGTLFATVTDFSKALLEALRAAGVDSKTAEEAARIAQDLVQSEINLPFLDRALDRKVLVGVDERLKQSLRAEAAATPPADLVANFPPGTVARITLDQLLQSDVRKREIVAAAIDRVVARDDLLLLRDVRDALIPELTGQGVAVAEANVIADNVLRLFTPQTSGNPLIDVPPQAVLKPSQLVEELSVAAVDKLTPGSNVFDARLEAERAGRVVANLRSDIVEAMRVLKEQSQDKVVEGIYQQVPVVSQPAVPLFALKNNVDTIMTKVVTNYMNPVAQEDIRTQNLANQPLNFKRNIDIPM